jgi:hypothetical protein
LCVLHPSTSSTIWPRIQQKLFILFLSALLDQGLSGDAAMGTRDDDEPAESGRSDVSSRKSVTTWVSDSVQPERMS